MPGGETDRFVDRWLRFDPVLDRRYNAEKGAARVAHLRETACAGLALFNIHNLTNVFLMPDVLWLAVVLRTLVVTPVGLLAVWHLDKMSATLREWTVLAMVTSAFAIEIVLFSLSQAAFGAYAFSEFGLTLVFGNMLMALRFRHAVLFTALSLALTLAVVWTKPSLDDALRFAFVVQIAMACVISLYANHKTERRRCRDFVVAHLAVLRAETSERDKRRFEDQSRTDALTGLANRRVLDERLAEWFVDDRPVTLMMLDLDHFKLFNDALGHPAGDDCLRRVGMVLGAAQAPDVLCARFGGEEFTIALRGADEAAAARFATTLVRSIEALGIAHPGRGDGTGVVTASIGVAFRPPRGAATPEGVLAAADRALYRAKRRGRNRCVMGDADERTAAAARA